MSSSRATSCGQPLSIMDFNPPVYAPVQRFPLHRQAYGKAVVRRFLTLPRLGEWDAGLRVHLQRPYHPAHVPGVDARRRFRVYLPQAFPQGFRAFLPSLGLQRSPQRWVWRYLRGVEALQQCADVLPGAAGQQGRFAPVLYVLYSFIGLCQVQGQAVWLIGIYNVHQVVRRQAQVLRRRLGGADVHVTVHQPAVAVDYLAVEALRQLERQAALACRGRPNNGDEGMRGALLQGV